MKMDNNGGYYVDLHIHTSCSDGVFTPQEAVAKALELGLKVIAITDHDSIDGLAPALKAAKGTALEVIPGVEISAIKGESEIHILGYFIDWKDPALAEALKDMQVKRVGRMEKIVQLMREHGFDMSLEKVIKAGKGGTVGRLHLARAMVKAKIVGSEKEAFDQYIGEGKSCYVRHKHLDYRKAIEMIKRAGGVPVLAHPAIMGSDEYFPDYIKAGLRGVEVFHTKHRPLTSDRYFELAEKYGLLVTGGSDCHGTGKRGVLMGKVRMDHEVVEKLREEAAKIRSKRSTCTD
ncbi:MAG: PHP domain-containing protein [Candidatus Omnitrophota bacterium]